MQHCITFFSWEIVFEPIAVDLILFPFYLKMISFLNKISIEPVVLLYVIAIFAEYSVVEDLILVNKCVHHLGLNTTDELHLCTEDVKSNKTSNSTVIKLITSETNTATLIYNGILYSMSIISSFVAAAYADRQSKLIPILIPILGSAFVQVLILISLAIPGDAGLPFVISHIGVGTMFVCAFVSGITGGTSTLISSCFAHVAENCSKSQRTSRITIVEACLFGGGFVAFSISGAILRNNPNSWLRYYLNFALFLCIHITLAFYVFTRRSMFPKPHQQQATETSELIENNNASIVSLLISVVRTVFRKRINYRQRYLIIFILATFIPISLWNALITTSLFIYTRGQLGWPSWKYFYFNSAKFGICGVFLCLLPIVQYTIINHFLRAPLSDSLIITIGLISRGSSILLIGLASFNDYFMLAALFVLIFAEYPIPAIRSLISKIIEPNEKTKIFVVIANIQSICFFVGGMVFPLFYNFFLYNISESKESGHFKGPSLLFILMGIIQFISLGIFM